MVIGRERALWQRMEETTTIQNFANEEVVLPLELTFGARFDTMRERRR